MKLKNDKWLITIDLDGTFLKTPKNYHDENYDFNPKNLEVIKKLIDLGHKVSIVTGRPWEDSREVYEAIGLDSIIANFNGAHVHNPNNKAFVPLTFSINKDILMEILEEPIIKEHANSCVIETMNKTFVAKGSDNEILGKVNSIGKKNRIEWEPGQDIEINPQAVLIGLNTTVDQYEVLHILNRKYGNAMFFRLWNSKDSDWIVLEINQIAANKGSALEQIAAYYNIPLSNTIAFGDGLNDREMLLKAAYGVAMKNAKGTVKTYADDVTDLTNDEAGVGVYLENFFELKK